MLLFRPMLHSGAAGAHLRFSVGVSASRLSAPLGSTASVRVLSQARTLLLTNSRLMIRPPAEIVPKYHGLRYTPSLIHLHYKGTPHHLHLPQHYLSGQLGAVSHFSSFFGGGGGKRPSGNRLAQGAGLIGAASILLGKSKYLLAGLKLTKFASLGSMILSIGTYSMFFGWPYATGIVGLTLVHETGHALVMRRLGVPFSPMVFVPFMGAVIAMRDHPRDAWDEALIALGGPVLGSMGAGAVAVAANATNSQLFYALADFGFMVNLFNLLPIGSMDGGRIAGAMSPYASVAGLGLGGLLAFNGAVVNPIFYLILLAGGYDTFQRFYNPNHMPPNYYKISGVQRSVLAFTYFGLIACLIGAMGANQRFRKSPEVLMRERELEKSWDMR